MKEGFEDRVALITGAGSGIGRATALAFAKAGAHVVATDINGDAAGQTAALIGDAAIAIAADIADEESVARAVTAALDAYGHIDVLSNNAGVIDNTGSAAGVRGGSAG